MDWKNFEPQPEEDLAVKRAVVMVIEGEDPFAPIQPIQGVTPRKCDKCGATIPFISNSATCPGGCKED